MSMTIEILMVLLLIVINRVFAMFEIAMVSSRKARLQQRGADGNKGAKIALEMLKKPNRFLSTVQIGITLVGIFTGAFGGAALAAPLAELIRKIHWLASYADALSLVFVVVLITYFSLVIGELIPKRLAMNKPEETVSRMAGTMRFFSKLARPFVNLLSKSTDFGVRLLGIKPSKEPIITEEEIKILVEQGRQIGVFEDAEKDMVSGVFRLGERRVDALMTPRTEIDWVDIEDSPAKIKDTLVKCEYSRIPVAKGDLDQVLGVVDVKDLLGINLEDPGFDLIDYARPAIFVPENTQALKALEVFRESGVHNALVIDEYGGLQGMVTLFDVLEAIVGDIPLNSEDTDQLAIQRADGSWLFDGLIVIDELKEILDIDEMPDEDRAAYQTLSGFIMGQLGSIPKAGQYFEWERFRFEVVDMDGRRVDKVLVSLLNNKADTQAET